MDLVELNDLTAGIEIITYEELGLCRLGEGGTLIDNGMVERKGL
jgi:acetyl-CoA acetyltransferase